MKGDNADKSILVWESAWGLGMSGRDIMLIQGERDPESLRNSELKSYKNFGYKDQEFISLYFLHLLKCNISITFDIYYSRLCGSPPGPRDSEDITLSPGVHNLAEKTDPGITNTLTL